MESACQTASGTIHRLVEARTQSMKQVASLSTVVNKAIHGIQSLLERVEGLEKLEFERIQNDWSAQTKQLQSMIVKLSDERDQLQSRLHHQLDLAERLQKENLALSDLLTGAEQFNRTRITCQYPNRKTHFDSDFDKRRSVEVQVDPWPSDKQFKFPGPLAVRKSLPNLTKSSCTVSRAYVMETPTDSQTSSVRFHPLSPASENTSTSGTVISTIERVHPNPSPDVDRTLVPSIDSKRSSVEFRTKFEIPVNQSPIPLRNDIQPNANGDSFDGLSSVTSPSEYANFALVDSRDQSVTKSSTRTDRYGLRTRALGSPSVAQPLGIRRSRSVHIRFPVPENSLYKLTDDARKSAVETGPYENQDAFLPAADPILPQACSTVRFIQNRSLAPSETADYENVSVEDTSVCDLAAKFLAEEQKYSCQLEQKIDAHLEVLKNQFGMNK
ncbi:unnamed protein product [Echinostoma caproni]|uniref:CEP63/Deup1 CEP152 binding coiled coil domain-containing protein n=1 Tax=Echinostoma caproni TaxID=27848 RepID=A0A3P8GLQ3_9TREM|nr:unnamed protein product [Echinostoma caproni]